MPRWNLLLSLLLSSTREFDPNFIKWSSLPFLPLPLCWSALSLPVGKIHFIFILTKIDAQFLSQHQAGGNPAVWVCHENNWIRFDCQLCAAQWARRQLESGAQKASLWPWKTPVPLTTAATIETASKVGNLVVNIMSYDFLVMRHTMSQWAIGTRNEQGWRKR